jgi:radical SAM protein with 4Fe4S-binding SPASM domain
MTENNLYSGPFYILELTQRCNHSCTHCYNVWKLGSDYPRGELDTEGWKRVIAKLKEERKCRSLILSGGEPLMREDFFEILGFIHSLGLAVILITNGSLLDESRIKRCLEHGVDTFELPLLSFRREVHNALSGAPSFDRVVNAIIDIKRAGGRIVSVFVMTAKNIGDFRETMELAFALGVDGIMVNRFNAGGAAVRTMKQLMPALHQLKRTLGAAQELSDKYALSVSCAIPMQPCLFNFDEYPDLGTGFCSVGTDRAYYTLDPLGNLRPCNHSSLILGNFLLEPFSALLEKEQMRQFITALPPFCMPCPRKSECQGGCKAAAQVCYNDMKAREPFLESALLELGEDFAYPR